MAMSVKAFVDLARGSGLSPVEKEKYVLDVVF